MSNIESWSMCSLFKLKSHSLSASNVVFSPNGENLASGYDDKTIGVWRVSSGELIKTLTGHSNCVLSVVFSPNGEYLASGSQDNTIGVWRVSNGERIKTFLGHKNPVLSLVFLRTESIWYLDLILSECGGYRTENESKHPLDTLIESSA